MLLIVPPCALCRFSVTLGSALSAALATWVVNGGHSTLYYTWGQYLQGHSPHSLLQCYADMMTGEHGVLWSLIEGPLVFIATDYITYWHHRVYHMPFLYKVTHPLD